MTARRLIRSWDPIQLGKLIVEIATGQVEDQTEDGKNPAAVARGRKREEGDQSLLLHFMPYNFVRIHHSLRITPAMAAGVTTKLWSLTDMVRVIEACEAQRATKLSDRLVG
jgi:hypothetical protein